MPGEIPSKPFVFPSLTAPMPAQLIGLPELPMGGASHDNCLNDELPDNKL